MCGSGNKQLPYRHLFCCTTSRLVLKSITRFKLFVSSPTLAAWVWLSEDFSCVCGVLCDWVMHESHRGVEFLIVCTAGSQFVDLWSHWTNKGIRRGFFFFVGFSFLLLMLHGEARESALNIGQIGGDESTNHKSISCIALRCLYTLSIKGSTSPFLPYLMKMNEFGQLKQGLF